MPQPTEITQFIFGQPLNWDGYCNPEIDALIERQSREGDPGRRKEVLWQIERKLAEDVARPIIFYTRGATCRQPYVKGFTQMSNSLFNGWRMEDVWLDK
jgi:peptide/nickel transport system substrate-binding protein